MASLMERTLSLIAFAAAALPACGASYLSAPTCGDDMACIVMGCGPASVPCPDEFVSVGFPARQHESAFRFFLPSDDDLWLSKHSSHFNDLRSILMDPATAYGGFYEPYGQVDRLQRFSPWHHPSGGLWYYASTTDPSCGISEGIIELMNNGDLAAASEVGTMTVRDGEVLGWERTCILADGGVDVVWHDGPPVCGPWEPCPVGSIDQCLGGSTIDVDGVRYRGCNSGIILRDDGAGWEVYAGTSGEWIESDEVVDNDGVLVADARFHDAEYPGLGATMGLRPLRDGRFTVFDAVDQVEWVVDPNSGSMTRFAGAGLERPETNDLPDGVTPTDYLPLSQTSECPGGTVLMAVFHGCVIAFEAGGGARVVLGECGKTSGAPVQHNRSPTVGSLEYVSDVRCDGNGRGWVLTSDYLYTFPVE